MPGWCGEAAEGSEVAVTSHEDLDADEDIFVQVQQAALSLANMVQKLRSGAYRAPDAGLHSPREK